MLSSNQSLLLSVLLFALISSTISRSIIRMPSATSRRNIHADENYLYCDSWRLSVETNNAGSWSTIPSSCVSFVQDYMTGDRFISDSETVVADSLAFALTVGIVGDGKDAWIFDVDDTLLSNLPYYQDNGWGSEPYNHTAYYEWVDLANAPAIPPSSFLFKELKKLGFTIFLLTGRDEFQRRRIFRLGKAYLEAGIRPGQKGCSL
ncbi:acid phosphatase 1-like [Tripterygium wilfordii]|uniref:acid phosphatase 1-like n=1 Tax=Tripterygium wilfordii TaxID=458696 RepID=UPI0018F808D6|nr:acid phosphatase 1-like [Tripterygium wilfordii]